jgi:hypothetical protein
MSFVTRRTPVSAATSNSAAAPLGGVPHEPGQDDVAVGCLRRDANGRGLVQRERVVRRLSQLRVVADVARRQPDL